MNFPEPGMQLVLSVLAFLSAPSLQLASGRRVCCDLFLPLRQRRRCWRRRCPTFTDFGIERLIELIQIYKENRELLKRCRVTWRHSQSGKRNTGYKK